jgi:hypothetical protein
VNYQIEYEFTTTTGSATLPALLYLGSSRAVASRAAAAAFLHCFSPLQALHGHITNKAALEAAALLSRLWAATSLTTTAAARAAVAILLYRLSTATSPTRALLSGLWAATSLTTTAAARAAVVILYGL